MVGDEWHAGETVFSEPTNTWKFLTTNLIIEYDETTNLRFYANFAGLGNRMAKATYEYSVLLIPEE